tara:strand:- start:1173 stop:2036 length:864 start_codon:yes stop_codon:yes gene_type:complete
MGLTITSSSYAGEHAGLYISPALKQAKSLEYITIRENVNYKEVVNKVVGADLVKDGTCAFNEQSASLTLTESVLEVEQFQVNLDVCKKTLLSDWAYAQQDDFVAYATSYLATSIADSVENSIWQGNTSTSGQFNKIATGSMTSSSAGGAFISGSGTGNIITELGTLASNIPTAVYGTEDLYIYMNKKTYRLYLSAISALSAFPFNHMGQYTPEFEGIKIAVCPGIADNVMYAGQKSNIFFGTSLSSDLTEISVLDMANLDGSQNVRMVARWTAGVQVGVASDFVYHA